jgi:hypothetical protein
MRTEESLYIRILLWAYSKQDGFTDQEIANEFKLHENTGGLYRWYLEVFRRGSNEIIHP